MALAGTAFLFSTPTLELPAEASSASSVSVNNFPTSTEVSNFPAGPFDVNVLSGGGSSAVDVEVFEIDIPNGAPNTAVTSVDVSTYSTLTVQVTGTWSGDVFLAAYLDPDEGGPSFKLFNYASGAPVSVVSGSGGSNQFFVGPTSGITSLSFGRAANWVSGSAHIYIRASKLPSPYVRVVNTSTQPIPVSTPRSNGVPTQAQTAVGTSSTQVLAANTARLTAVVHNHSDEQLYVSLSGAASSTNFVQVLREHEYYELPIRAEFRGAIYAARPSGAVTTDPVVVTEFVEG